MVLASIPLAFVLPPDGATDVPTDARVVAAAEIGEAVTFEVTVDGELWSGSRGVDPDTVHFEPDAPFPPGASVEVALRVGGDVEFFGFETSDRITPDLQSVPQVGPILQTELLADREVPLWSFAVDARQPDAEPHGYFRIAYREIEGENPTSVDLVWPADEEPTEGVWEDRAPATGYCVGVQYTDVAGQMSTPSEICADLGVDGAQAGLGTGCAVAPGGPTSAWLLALGLLGLRRR